jgi:hypothetical protein
MNKTSARMILAAVSLLACGLFQSARTQEADAGPRQPPAQQSANPAAPAQPRTTQPQSTPAADAAAKTAPSAASSDTKASSPASAETAGTPSIADADKITVPAGTELPLLLHNGISTRSAREGDPVYLETIFPVLVGQKVVIPVGSFVSGEVTESKRPGRVKGRGELGIKLNKIVLPNSYVIDLNASPSGASTGGGETVDAEGRIQGDTSKASDAGTVLKTTGAGAGIGGIAGGAKGAGIGAGIGAVGGLITVLLSRGPEAEMPRGSTINAVLNRPLVLDASKIQFAGPGQASAMPGPPNREPVRSAVPF